MCKTCGRSFSTKSNMKRHQLAHKNEGNYICCGVHFRDRWDFKRHRANKHGEPKRHECTTCSMKFATAWHLKRHERTHNNKDYISCPTCGLQCRDQSGLNEHMASHENKRRFICYKCERSFKYKTNLTRHKKCHWLWIVLLLCIYRVLFDETFDHNIQASLWKCHLSFEKCIGFLRRFHKMITFSN